MDTAHFKSKESKTVEREEIIKVLGAIIKLILIFAVNNFGLRFSKIVFKR